MRGDRLRELRKSKKITQDKLAELAGISREQVNRYENGKSVPDFATIIKLADALNTSIDYLIGRNDINASDNSSSQPTPLPIHKETISNSLPILEEPVNSNPSEYQGKPVFELVEQLHNPQFVAALTAALEPIIKERILQAIQEDISSLKKTDAN